MIATILNSAILHSVMLHKTLTQSNSIWLKLIHSDWTWWWQPSWILPSWIQPFCTKLWLSLIQSDSNSFILTQLDDGSHLELCHHGFSHLHKKNITHAFSLKLNNGSHLEFCYHGFSHCHLAFKNLVFFTHSFWLNLTDGTPYLNSDSVFNSAILDKKISNLIILTQLDDDNRLEFCHLGFRDLIIFSQIHSKTLWLQLIQSHSNSFILT